MTCDDSGGNYLPWAYAVFGACVWTPLQKTSFYFGLGGLALFMLSQLPQLALTCMLCKSELSWYYLLFLLAANLIGCFLTNSILTAQIQSVYFVLMDLVLIVQFMMYGCIKKRYVIPAMKKAWIYAKVGLKLLKNNRQPTSLKSDAALTNNKDNLEMETPMPEGTGLTKQEEVLETPKDVMNEQDEVRISFENCDNEEKPMPVRRRSNIEGVKEEPKKKQDVVEDCVGEMASQDAPASTMVNMEIADATSSSTQRIVSVVLLAVATFTTLGLKSFMNTASFAPNAEFSFSGALGRRLMSKQVARESQSFFWFFRSYEEMLGFIVAVVSGTLYTVSRFPQLWKNCIRFSTDGVSIPMFALTFAANSTYTVSILTGGFEIDYWLRQSPIILGAFSVIFLDGILMIQHIMLTYILPICIPALRKKNKELRKQKKIEKERLKKLKASAQEKEHLKQTQKLLENDKEMDEENVVGSFPKNPRQSNNLKMKHISPQNVARNSQDEDEECSSPEQSPHHATKISVPNLSVNVPHANQHVPYYRANSQSSLPSPSCDDVLIEAK